MEVFGAMAKSGGRHQSAAKMVAAIFLRGWCRQTLLPPSADVWGMAVGKVGWSRYYGRKRGRAVVLGDS